MSIAPTPLNHAIEELASAFQEFKITNDQRLAAVEKRMTDPLAEDKLSKLHQGMDALQMRLQRMEVVPNRPSLSYENHRSGQEIEHKKAFLDYICKGREQELSLFEKKAWTSENEGGYFLPTMLTSEIYNGLQAASVLRSVASVATIARHQYELLVEKTPHEISWHSEENLEKYKDDPESPKIQKLVFPVHTMFDRQRISQTLLEDTALDAGQWLVDLITRRMIQAENNAFLNGTGKFTPQGILGAYETSEEAEWGKLQTFKTGIQGKLPEHNPENCLIHTLYSLKSEYLREAHWIMSRSALAAIRLLKTPEGHYLWQPTLSADFSKSTLLGYPVLLSDDMPSLSADKASAPIVFGNFKEGYQIVDRTGITIQRDPYTAKPHIELYLTMRVGGGIKNFDAIKVLSASE